MPKRLNNHIKYVELDPYTQRFRITERNRRGRIFGSSKWTDYQAEVEEMFHTIELFGYRHDHDTNQCYVFKEVA